MFNRIKKYQLFLSHSVLAILCCFATQWFCNKANKEKMVAMERKIAALQEEDRNALITKRISEQMEDIAYQQKAISDIERQRAEKQSQIADMQRQKADIQRRHAQEAEVKALFSARQADSMRVIAVQETKNATHHAMVAQVEKDRADTLFYTSLGRLLAQSAIQQSNAGNQTLASLLSYSAWYYTKTYNGNQYQQDVFSALVKTSQADQTFENLAKGNVRWMALHKKSTDTQFLVAITDYGEMVYIPSNKAQTDDTAKPQKTRILFADKKYDFRGVVLDEYNRAVALDANGAVVTVELNETRKQEVLRPLPPIDIWHKLIVSPDGQLIAVGRHNVAWLTKDYRAVAKLEKLQGFITAVGQHPDGALLLFLRGGSMVSYKNSQPQQSLQIPVFAQDQATAHVFYPKMQYDIVGSQSGSVYVLDKEGKCVSTLLGHTGGITDMYQFSRMVMTASYDCSLRIWDMGNINSTIVSNQVNYTKWPLCLLYDPAAASLKIGFADGEIHSLCISAKSNALKTQQFIDREFTPQEWNYYIGSNVPKESFMP